MPVAALLGISRGRPIERLRHYRRDIANFILHGAPRTDSVTNFPALVSAPLAE